MHMLLGRGRWGVLTFMLTCVQSQQPCEPKTDAKHQGVAMALDELLEVTGLSLKKRMAM